jgi:hypothetical protein
MQPKFMFGGPSVIVFQEILMRLPGLMLLILAPSLAPLLLSQQPAAAVAQPSVGQVSGRVYCGDTDQPARFASVQLIGEHPSAAAVFDTEALAKGDFEKSFAVAMTAVMKGGNSSLSALTALDGTFSLDKVPPGTYWVVAQLAGYLSPLSQLSPIERAKAGDDALKVVQSSAEKIVVQSNQSAHVDLRLERGASISGTVHYDDGSPAPGVNPALMKLDKDGKWKDLGVVSTLPANTDDHGRYRIYGLLPGKYAVKATLPAIQAASGLGAMPSLNSSMGDMLLVYSGGALHEKDIKPVEVGPGEEVDGIDVVFPIDNLHTIAGTVVAKSDQHPVNAGWIALEEADTKTRTRGTSIDQDGSFRINYVLDGQYILKVEGASDTDRPPDTGSGGNFALFTQRKTLKSYGAAELPLAIKSDSTGLLLQVPDVSATPAKGSPSQGSAAAQPPSTP